VDGGFHVHHEIQNKKSEKFQTLPQSQRLTNFNFHPDDGERCGAEARRGCDERGRRAKVAAEWDVST
jgi:hypothetical protein